MDEPIGHAQRLAAIRSGEEKKAQLCVEKHTRTIMSWYRKLLITRNQLKPLGAASVILLTMSSLISPSALAEVLSFSIINERFEFRDTHTVTATPRLDRLRESFFLAPIKESEFQISSNFGLRRHPVLKKQKVHAGIDYSAPKGTSIQATADGTVAFIGRQKGYGKVIIIEHAANLTTVYAHQSRFASGLKKGDAVSRGNTIGYVGSTGMVTGNNLHYEVRLDNQPINPLKVDRLLVENEYFFDSIN